MPQEVDLNEVEAAVFKKVGVVMLHVSCNNGTALEAASTLGFIPSGKSTSQGLV